jgi:hypothetical protein
MASLREVTLLGLNILLILGIWKRRVRRVAIIQFSSLKG